MIKRLCAAALFLGLTWPAQADFLPGRIAGEGVDGVAFALARAEHVVTLVRKTRDITLDRQPFDTRASDLRVSLVVLDNGSSTDLSPSHDIHIAMFNDVDEHGLAFAVEPVQAVFGFRDVERTAPGIYQVTAVTLNTANTFGGCGFLLSRITVDARELSVAVRQAKGLGEFQIQRYAVPVAITQKALGCA